MSQMPPREELDRRIRQTSNCGLETEGFTSGEEIRRHDLELELRQTEANVVANMVPVPVVAPVRITRRVLAL